MKFKVARKSTEKPWTFPARWQVTELQSTGFFPTEREERVPPGRGAKPPDHRKTSPIPLTRRILDATKTGLACSEHRLGLALGFLQSAHTLIRCSLTD